MSRRLLKHRQVYVYAPQVIHSLAFYAERLGLFDTHLAEMLGRHRTTVQYWWSGRTVPSLNTLEEVCADLDLRVRLTTTPAYYKRLERNREFVDDQRIRSPIERG